VHADDEDRGPDGYVCEGDGRSTHPRARPLLAVVVAARLPGRRRGKAGAFDVVASPASMRAWPSVPAGALVAFTVVAVLGGILAAVLPARRAARLDVLTALAYE
jgi:ABC-type antimicrobial peptide transport system permease subunit